MNTKKKNNLLRFPGGEIINKGLNDILHHKNKTIEALVVFTASPRLNDLGFHIKVDTFAYPHLMLYAKLKKEFKDSAYSQYRAIMNRTAKFCNYYKP